MVRYFYRTPRESQGGESFLLNAITEQDARSTGDTGKWLQKKKPVNPNIRVMIRKHIVFSGQVQGVGFRWRAGKAARLYGCTGWCRNDWDGSVTMEIQGKEEAVGKVLESLENGRFIRIHHMEVKELPPETDERDFVIRDGS